MIEIKDEIFNERFIVRIKEFSNEKGEKYLRIYFDNGEMIKIDDAGIENIKLLGINE